MVKYTATIPAGAAPTSHKAEIIDLKELVSTLLERVEMLESQMQELQTQTKENTNDIHQIARNL
jgi:hypothetical protein